MEKLNKTKEFLNQSKILHKSNQNPEFYHFGKCLAIFKLLLVSLSIQFTV